MISFLKADGTTRVMKATLDWTLIELFASKHEKKTDRVKKENPEVLAVFDMEKEEWRSLNLTRFISIK